MGAPQQPNVAGVDVEAHIGSGGHGDVWRGRMHSTGERVALKVLRGTAQASDGDRDRWVREAALLRRIADPHVVRLRQVLDCGAGIVLVLDHADGGDVASLVAARGHLDPGEVVTLLVPLAQALARLHDAGIVHGDIAPGNILLSGAGTPLLADLGTARIIGVPVDGRDDADVDATAGYVDPAVLHGAAPSAAGDVYSLAACAWHALTGYPPPLPSQRPPLVVLAPQVPRALALALEQAMDADPPRRPSPADLAREAFGAATPEAVRLVPVTGLPAAEAVTHRVRRAAMEAARAEPPPRRRGRRALIGAGVAALVVALVAGSLGGMVRTGEDGEPHQVVPEQAPPALPVTAPDPVAGDDPAAAVPVLADRRARAFASAEPSLLALTDADDSAAMRVDAVAVGRLATAGHRLDGLALMVTSARTESHVGDSATVRVALVTGAHTVVDASGEVVARVHATGPVAVRLVMRRGVQGWRVEQVLDAPTTRAS